MVPEFSVITPSYLGPYPGAASDRDLKLVRAITSAINQSFHGWELILIADGCANTRRTYERLWADDSRIRCYAIPKAETWCPSVRNAGLTMAAGRWVVYLDSDDFWDGGHLQWLSDALATRHDMQWAWFDVLIPRCGIFVPMGADIKRCAKHGTANIVHRRGPLWPTQRTDRSSGALDYGTQDCAFTDVLKQMQGGEYLGISGYHVCHLPGRFDI